MVPNTLLLDCNTASYRYPIGPQVYLLLNGTTRDQCLAQWNSTYCNDQHRIGSAWKSSYCSLFRDYPYV